MASNSQMGEPELLESLVAVAERIALGDYDKAKRLFEFTKKKDYPQHIASLAEAIGIMVVKVEAREYRLERVIAQLKAIQGELEAARARLSAENVRLREGLREKFKPSRILGKSAVVLELLRQTEKVAGSPVDVLIVGETGTGKELVAKAIHYNSPRAHQAFVDMNCSAIPENLFEAEMFGIEKGVATGVDGRVGKIEQAHQGTLFLDEIGEMPPSCQSKMLRVIEERNLERVGGRRKIPVDIRIVAATNKNLRREAEKGAFRQDLFYRLNVVELVVPPLRERKDDIPLLANFFLDQHVRRAGQVPMSISEKAMERLLDYHWPGNVRELENEMERAATLAASETITAEDLSRHLRQGGNGGAVHAPSLDSPQDYERAYLQRILADSGNNKSEAARRLGVTRQGLWKKLKRHGLM